MTVKRHVITTLTVILMTCVFSGCDSKVSSPVAEQPRDTTSSTSGQQSFLISVQELHESLLAENQIKLVDIRAASYFSRGHIKGAISIPLEQLPERLGELPISEEVIVYANCA